MSDKLIMDYAGPGITLNVPKIYEIDFDKVKTLEDVKTILKHLNLTVHEYAETFELLKPFLKL